MTHWLAAALTVFTVAGSSKPIAPCKTFEAHLRIAASGVRRGERPEFTLVVRNTSKTPLRLLDTRNGRRSDLGNTYYKLVVTAPDGKVADILQVISEPGPISPLDYFALLPGETADIALRPTSALESLAPATYRAHVAVWVDPYEIKSVCRSDSLEFHVQ